MPRKRYSTEQIVTKLRQAEVELSRAACARPRSARSWGSASRPVTDTRRVFLGAAGAQESGEQIGCRLSKC